MRKKFDKYYKKQYSDLLSTIEYNFIQTIAMAHKLGSFKEITTFTADNIIDRMILKYNHIHVRAEKQYLRCKNINVKIQIQIKIKENSGKEKMCARLEIAFFPLVFKATPNTRLVIYILAHLWHLSSIIVAKNMAGDDANNNVFNKNKKNIMKSKQKWFDVFI